MTELTQQLSELRAELATRDQQICDLQADRQVLQTLVESSQEETSQAKEELSKVQQVKQLQRPQVQQIVARIKVQESGYSLIKTQESLEWYKDSSIINIQEQLAADFKACAQVNYGSCFSQVKTLEQNLADCMQQYEERLTRVNNYMEESNQTYLKTQEELKQVRVKQEQETKKKDAFVAALLETSSALKQKMKLAGRDCLVQLEMSVSKLMELKPPDTVCTELRDHVLDLYQRGVLGIIKEKLKNEDQARREKEAADRALSTARQESEAVRGDKQRLDSAFEEKIMELAKFKSDYFALVAQQQE